MITDSSTPVGRSDPCEPIAFRCILTHRFVTGYCSQSQWSWFGQIPFPFAQKLRWSPRSDSRWRIKTLRCSFTSNSSKETHKSSGSRAVSVTPPPSTPITLTCKSPHRRAVLRSQVLRATAAKSPIPPHIYHAISLHLDEAFATGKYLKDGPLKQGEAPPAAPNILSDPNAMDGMMTGMKAQMVMMVPQMVIMGWINFFFQGFVLSECLWRLNCNPIAYPELVVPLVPECSANPRWAHFLRFLISESELGLGLSEQKCSCELTEFIPHS